MGCIFDLKSLWRKLLSLGARSMKLDESNLKAISFILEQGPAKVAMHRVETLKYYVMRARELAGRSGHFTGPWMSR